MWSLPGVAAHMSPCVGVLPAFCLELSSCSYGAVSSMDFFLCSSHSSSDS